MPRSAQTHTQTTAANFAQFARSQHPVLLFLYGFSSFFYTILGVHIVWNSDRISVQPTLVSFKFIGFWAYLQGFLSFLADFIDTIILDQSRSFFISADNISAKLLAIACIYTTIMDFLLVVDIQIVDLLIVMLYLSSFLLYGISVDSYAQKRFRLKFTVHFLWHLCSCAAGGLLVDRMILN